MTWNEYFFNMCNAVKLKSKDTSVQVGIVIVGKNHEVLTTGFNGFPKGVTDNINLVPERYERPDKYLWTEHAERNAIFFAARNGIRLEGSTLYQNGHPCAQCTRAIIQAGIKTIKVRKETAYNFCNSGRTPEIQEMWRKEFEVADQMIKESGTNFYLIDIRENKCTCEARDLMYYGCRCELTKTIENKRP